jgi:prolyl-tRNA editing enzyme YbaK/EbsC (Cys-tRNA(Pro) deacylase)
LRARIVFRVWPDEVERVAAFLRASGTEGRLEEVLPDSEPPPGLELTADTFECEGGRTVVGLVPEGRSLDQRKLAAAAGCPELRTAARSSAFPFQGAAVFLDQSALAVPTVWLELEAARHFLGLAPAQFLRLTRSKSTDLLVEDRIGGG